jgi:membrane protease YdiL (CAAX protease family)
MTMSQTTGSRTRAYGEFLAAILYFFIARSLARHGAEGLFNEVWSPLVSQAMLCFLLILGFAAFGRMFNRQQHAISEQGLPWREGWHGEVGLGLAIGWSVAVVCVLPLALIGGIAIVLSPQFSYWGWLLSDIAFFAFAALAEEVAFRGYAFQRFVAVVGPLGASLGFAVFYAIVQSLQPGSSGISIAVSMVFTLVLSMAYLRTRALWLSWGLNFGWKASRAIIFGLTVCGVSSHSSVVEGNPMGPYWLTGGGYGLDGSWLAFFVLLLAVPVVYRVTRDLDFRYNAPVIVPGGIPVDLDAASRSQHEAAMGSAEPAAPPLVQIATAPTPPAHGQSDESAGNTPPEGH